MSLNLNGKTVVITGSTRGIGRAMAEACAGDGANVVICSRSADSVAGMVSRLTEAGRKAAGISVDVSRYEDVDKLREFAVATFGRIDVWINNAGISQGYQELGSLEPEDIQRIVDINLIGALNGCRAVLPYFEKAGGVLINLNGMGSAGETAPYLSVYAATKLAIAGLTRSLAAEYKEFPVSIHAIMPGIVATDLVNNTVYNERTEKMKSSMPYVQKAFGNTLENVGLNTARIAAQVPGKKTGKFYNLVKGWRKFKGILLISWYGMTGKLG